jgi:exosome complex exonuclease RRP6
MLYYARSDTHYLLYIYDMVRNELVSRSDRNTPETDLVQWVVGKSKEVSLQRYEGLAADSETGYGPRGWFNPLVKSSFPYNSEQFAVYKAVHKWRDDKARRDDESPMFIMSHNVLSDVAKILPTDQKALWSLLQNYARSLQPHHKELFRLIQQARAAGVNGPSLVDMLRSDNVGSVAAKVFGDRTADKAKSVGSEAHVIPNIKELRSERSQLWGDMPMSSLWEEGPKKAGSETEKEEGIPLPWAQYITKLEYDNTPSTPSQLQGTEAEDVQMDEPSIPTEPAQSPAQDAGSSGSAGRDSDAEFNLKREGSKKSSKKGSKDSSTKSSKKRKAANSSAETEGTSEGVDEVEEEPFDYKSAQSVLHGPGVNGKDDKRKKNKDKKNKKSDAADPFASKTSQGPKGARNLNSHKAGKTATFKK